MIKIRGTNRYEKSSLNLEENEYVVFKKTLFKNKETFSCSCLMDDLMSFENHKRYTEDAVARMLEKSVQSS